MAYCAVHPISAEDSEKSHCPQLPHHSTHHPTQDGHSSQASKHPPCQSLHPKCTAQWGPLKEQPVRADCVDRRQKEERKEQKEEGEGSLRASTGGTKQGGTIIIA